MKNPCTVLKKCNACSLSNLDDESQLKFKQNICQKTLGKFCKVMPISPAEHPLRYRNKAQFLFKKDGKTLRYGVYRSSNRSVCPVDDCVICTERANEVTAALAKLFQSFKVQPFDFHRGTGWLKSVTIREGFRSGELMVVINGTDANFPAKKTFSSALLKACPFITTAVVTHGKGAKLFTGEVSDVLIGDGFITDILCEKRFIISPSSFFQINPAQTERLYQKAVELAALSGRETVLDAYCGVGAIGICAADMAKRVIAVEENPSAIKDARKNAKINGVKNIDFVRADAKDFAKELWERGEKIDAAFIDPPRAGCAASFLGALAKLGPEKIVYISCNIETQARDIRLLHRLGYEAKICCPFDLFPHTRHVESAVLMTKIKRDRR